MTAHSNKKSFFNLFKIVISLGLISWILLKTDFQNLSRVLSGVKINYLMLAVGFMLLEMLSMTLRMYYLIRIKLMSVPFSALLKFNMMGVFIGNFMPTKLGVDGLRTYYLARHTNQTVDSITSIALDRFINIIVITTFALFSYIVGGYYRRFPALGLIIIVMIIGIFLILILISQQWSHRLGNYLTSKRWSQKIVKFIHDLTVSFEQFRHHPRQLFWIVFLGIIFQVNRIITTYFFARAVHIDVDFAYFFLVIPMVIILGMLPFSVAGIGITQYSTVQMFKLVGVQIESSLGFAMLIYFARIFIALPGLYFFHKEGMDTLMESISKIGSGFSRKKNEEKSN
ncbi:flippase-like domain-containing protein [bacterium]|nr:flippase-like domain-containing protein [bacterium]